jgi:hypothetical protein
MVTTELLSRVILKDQNTWTEWLMALKSRVVEQEVWKYIDPASNIPEPKEPELPEREAAQRAAKEKNDRGFKALLAAW